MRLIYNLANLCSFLKKKSICTIFSNICTKKYTLVNCSEKKFALLMEKVENKYTQICLNGRKKKEGELLCT